MPHNPSPCAPRRASPFVRLWTSVVAANFADGVLRVALPLIAVDAGATALEVSFVVAGSSLPWLLVTMPAGVIADRFERSVTIRTASLVRVPIGFVVLALLRAYETGVVVLTLAAVMFGVAEVITDVSSQTEVASIVAPDRLEAGFGRLTSGRLAAELLVGPAFAGVVFQWSPSAAIASTIVTFAVAGLVIRPANPRCTGLRPSSPPGSRWRWWIDAFDGLRVLAAHRWMRRAAIAAGVLNFTSAGGAAVLITYALSSRGLDLNQRDFGFLLTVIGVGGVIGGIVGPRIHRLIGDERSLLVGASGFVLADIAPGIITQPITLAVMSSIGLAIGMIYSTKVISLRQRLLDDEIRDASTPHPSSSGRAPPRWARSSAGSLPQVSDSARRSSSSV